MIFTPRTLLIWSNNDAVSQRWATFWFPICMLLSGCGHALDSVASIILLVSLLLLRGSRDNEMIIKPANNR